MRIVILGAECTGKTELAQALASHLQTRNPRVTWVTEYLREWCAQTGRTPRVDEQVEIARVQMQRILAQPPGALVLCDTSSLMTAVYSDVVFGDTSLYPAALQMHAAFSLTLLTGLDLPWVSDGIQRDGIDMRVRVDQRLRAVLQQHGLAYSTVYGSGSERTQCAALAVEQALGSFRTEPLPTHWKWNCEKCSDSECEHRLFSALLQKA